MFYQIKKNTILKAKEDKEYNATMAAIDRAASSAMERDLISNPRLMVQYGIGKPGTAASTGIQTYDY